MEPHSRDHQQQQHRRDNDHDDDGVQDGFYTTHHPQQYQQQQYGNHGRSMNPYLTAAQPDTSSLKTSSELPSPTASPRPSTSQLVVEDPNQPHSPGEGPQQYYHLTDPQIRYAAVQQDLGGGGASRITSYAESSTTLGSVNALIAPVTTSKAHVVSSHYRNAVPKDASGLRNAYPMSQVGPQGARNTRPYPGNASAPSSAPSAMRAAPAPHAAGNAAPQRPHLPVIKGEISEKKSFQQRQPWFIRFMILFVIGAIAGGVVAAIKIIQAHNAARNAPPSAGPGGFATYFTLPKWDFTSSGSRVFGVNLGNWLVLERWLDEDSFVSMCGSTVFDEYHCVKNLGHSAALTALQQHQDNFVAESDIDAMQKLGINVVRISLGFWALIPTQGNEPYVNAGQMNQLKKMLGWLNTRKMRAIISLHGMPGSQSGDQSTGQFRNSSRGANWFNAQNQQRSIATVQALMDWISALTPELASTVAAVLPVNEPNQMTNDDGTFQATLENFYSLAYAIINKANVVMALHSGMGPNSKPAMWASWLADKDPSTLLWEVHAYPGWFPSRSSQHSIYNRICDVVQLPQSLPSGLPIFVGEWSAISGVEGVDGWTQQFYQTQLAAYSQSAGSAFWTWKSTSSSSPVVALSSDKMAMYNFQGLATQGLISTPSSASAAGLAQYLASLPNNACSLAASTAPAPGTNATASGTGSGSGSGSDVDDGIGNPAPGQERRRR